jgi:uncharacterized protein (TIGR02001 family)
MVLQGTCGPAWAEGQWSGQIAATSDYIFRGVSQTDGHPAVQGSLAYQALSGWYAGVWASSLERNEWYYPAGTAEVEIDVFAGFGRTLSDHWSTDVQATGYLYPGDGDVVSYDYAELEVALSYRDAVRLSLSWSPDAALVTRDALIEGGRSLATEIALRQPLNHWLSIVAGAGYRDIERASTGGYGYWSAGFTARKGPLTIDLARYGTNEDGRELFGYDSAGSRTALSIAWAF